MSRSRRKTPIVGIAKSESDKWYKVLWHRINRARLRGLLAHEQYDDADTDTPYNDWNAPKDGKQYLKSETIERMPELMRK